MKRADEARARAAERAAHREHRRAVRERIAELRAKLRAAIKAKKARMKEIVRACREQRLAARDRIQAMRKEALRELAESIRAAREAARAECSKRKADARKTYQSAVDIARADLLAERQRQAEERRLRREERARHAAVKKAHKTGGAAHRRVRAPMAEALAPLAAKATPAPGESPVEAVLKYAETHPEAAHAVLEPAAERAIEATAAQIAALERAADAPTVHDLARAGRAAKRRRKARGEAATAAAAPGEEPATIRGAFNEAIDAYRRSWPNSQTARANARHIVAALRKHPWLSDQIPQDILGLAQRDAQAAETTEQIERAAKRAAARPATYAPLTSKPRKGQHLRVRYDSGEVGEYVVTEVRDDGIVWMQRPGNEPTTIIYRHADGSFNPHIDVRTTASRARTKPRAAKREAAPPASAWQGEGYDDRILCVRCGCRGGQHRASDGKCPQTLSWSRPAPDPMSNHTLDGAALDAALAAYWSATPTFYRSVTARGPDEASAPAARPPNAYEQKKAARVERMRARADKLKSASTGALKRADAIASMIPMGQPILVGHHSEKRHRRDIKRIQEGYSKAFALGKEAEAVERRADFAEKNRAISSDDPNAVDKLRAKLAALNSERAKWKLLNQAVRAAKNDEGALRVSLARLGMPESLARELLTPDFVGRIGIPDYKFTNATNEARRLEQRIKQLETQATAPEKPAETIGEARIYEADNRVRVEFPSKPSEEVRTRLKRAGFHWSKALGAWQRHASHGAWYDARQIAAQTVSP